MTYYFAKTVSASLEDAEKKVTQALKSEGFGILTEIDVKATLRKKLDVDFHPYKILGACNPPFALQALQAEEKIGLMLPCNVIIQEKEPGKCEVAAIDPLTAMGMIPNPKLKDIAGNVRAKLIKVIETL